MDRCAGSSATPGRTRRARSSWPGSGGWNTAGYDSAGVATLDGARLDVRKRAGRVRMLEAALRGEPAPGPCGISHTRWATHGPASDRNAHPHVGGDDGPVAVVHNGVIENHAALRRELEASGVEFRSQTDTEVIAHLIARELGDGDDLFEAAPPRPAPARRDVWPGRRQPALPRPGRRREAGQPAGRRPRGRRALPGQRPRRHRPAHGPGGVPPGRRGRPPDPARLRDPPPRARVDHPADRPDRLVARPRRAGRPRPLHAQGDPRAARHGPRRLPGPAPPGRGDGRIRRPEHDRRGSSAGSAGSSSPPAGRAGMPPWWANTSSSGWRTCRSRSSTPASSATGTPRSTTGPSSSS